MTRSRGGITDKGDEALKRLGLFLLSVVAFGWTAHLPATATRPTTRPAGNFTIASYNINYGNVNLKEVVETIQKSDAVLVCLQETNRQSEIHLRRSLSRKYRYIYFRADRWAGGFGILSKSPIKNVRYLPKKYGYFGTLLFRTRLGGKEVQLANIHLHPTIPRQGENLTELLELLSKTETIRIREIEYIYDNLIKTLPTVLVGDFNSPPYMTVPDFLAKRGFVDSFTAATPNANSHVTWRRRHRDVEWKFRLDYIFHNKHFRTVAGRIIKSDASDHYLVNSTLTWAPRSTTKPTTKPSATRH
ncbi:MAG: endonuclease/exonuclease/phosphatase family protein [Planctomycetota bacterium]|nr:endonuclease/exonuclease/phosphatase family protein [Planctomycetota bacterium]